MATKKVEKNIVNACVKACKSFSTSLPMLLGIILLMGLFQTFISPTMISSVFSGEMVRDTFIGTLIGSISAGNPITSYIIGGGLLNKGVSLFAVAAFIVAWVTIGIIQFIKRMVRIHGGKRDWEMSSMNLKEDILCLNFSIED